MIYRIKKAPKKYWPERFNPNFDVHCFIIGCHGNPLCNNVSI